MALLFAGTYGLLRPAAIAAQSPLPLPPLPAGWPGTLEVGLSDAPGGAAALAAAAPFRFRYQYLAAGVNTGYGWATWNSDGHFVTYYIQDSLANGITPVFTYYMIYQSLPGGGSESNAIATNLRNVDTMRAYYHDLRLFFQRAGAFPSQMVVLHVEPDMWGFMQQSAAGDNAANYAVKVASTGVPEVAGLPENGVGLARAIKTLRDTYAPNVRLAYHTSIWGTGVDIQYSQSSDAEVDALAARAGAFYRSLQTDFDLAFGEFSDRDAAFKQIHYGDGGRSWFDADDFRRHARFMGAFSQAAGERLVLWQIPLGNTRMRAMDNSWGHYQDNRAEWLFDDLTRAHLDEYRQAGVIAFLFGAGASGTTHASDATGDGVTNPAPINGNVGLSLSADDDGGFFKDRVRAYHAAGAMSLLGGVLPGPTATNTPIPTNTPSNTPSPTATRTPVPTGTNTPPPSATRTPVATSTPPSTATSTPLSGATSTPVPATATAVPTGTPAASNTGYAGPRSDAAQTGGDGNGFEAAALGAYADDGVFAVDTDSGTGWLSSCASTRKDRHQFANYGFALPNGVAVTGVEVRLDAKVDSTAGAPKLCVQLSWNGGVTWTAARRTGTLATSEASYVLGGASDRWGHNWSRDEVADGAFRVRVISTANSTARDFSLDWVAVRVHYR